MGYVTADIPEDVHLRILEYARKHNLMRKIKSRTESGWAWISIPNQSEAMRRLLLKGLENSI
jgi:hypothetical protein